MTKLEKLQQNYEDAAFALMMYHIAAQRGAEAVRENELLRADPETAVPPQLRQRCCRTIRRQFTRQQTQTVRRVLGRAVNRVAVAVLVMVLLFTTAFAASPDFRAHTLNLLVENFGDRTRFQLTETAAPTGLDSYDIQAGWLPEGFVEEEELSGISHKGLKYRYDNEKLISVIVYDLMRKSVSIDTENTEASYIPIQNTSATLVQNGDSFQLAFIPNDISFMVIVRSERFSLSELLLVAENIQISPK